MRGTLWIAFGLFLISGQLHGQLKYGHASVLVQDSSNNKKINYFIVEPPSGRSETSSNENLQVIVRLKSEPLLKQARTTSARTTSLEAEHDQFISDLSRFARNSNSARSSNAARINYEYRRVFNGFALEASREVVEHIKSLTYVSAVLEDKAVRAYDIVSNGIINAPQVWSNYGVTGKGVRIGIIDTGIDYNHPDLGGGMGSTFKVRGGYDFVNNDADPMDDNGHGTHVAGIAAANGTGLKGVAPDALIYAYKALGKDGVGIDSWILSAIERCTDPDQNPDTDDALDVVNMSLGRPVDPSEPISEAVNNAIAKGVVFVVAAGNDYNFGTIGTPGVAEDAITVAATDETDATADFSSKGPTPEEYLAKPDIAAPGVGIYSSFLNNAYKKSSGTSMASPHVAGAAALLLEKNPTWTPGFVKAVLMQSAKPSQENLFHQGIGRLDVSKAISQQFAITPATVSLGLLDSSSPVKTYNVSIQVSNVCGVAKSLTLKPENFPSAITVVPHETQFSLAPGTTKTVSISISVNVGSLPFINYPDAYFGSIVADGGDTKAVVPITLLNPTITKMVFSGELPQSIFQVGLDGNYFNHQYPTSSEMKLLLPPGAFDLISIYGNRIVVNENINGQINNTLTIDKSLAKNIITFQAKDENGNALSYNPSTVGSVTFAGKSRNFICFFPYAEDTVYVSDQSPYYLSMRLRDKISAGNNAFYDIAINTPEGIHESKTYSNDQNNFIKLDILNPGIPSGATQDVFYHSQGQVFGLINSNPITASNPMVIFHSTGIGNIPAYSYVQFTPQGGQSGYSWETGGFNISNNDSIYFFDSQRQLLTSEKVENNNYQYVLGKSLLRMNARTYNRNNQIIFHDFPSLGSFNHHRGERNKGSVYYKLTQDAVVVKSGSFVNRTSDQFVTVNNVEHADASGEYTLSLNYEGNNVKGKAGTALANLKFDMNSTDKNPPSLQFLSLEANGMSTNHLETGGKGKVKFGISDVCLSYYGMECSDENSGIQSLELQIKNETESEWITLAVVESSSAANNFEKYESDIPDELANGYYELKIKATDLSNNSIEYLLKPAFLIGPASSVSYSHVSLLEPKQDAYGTGLYPIFKWSAVDNITGYVIQISQSNSFDDVIESSSTSPTYQHGTPLNNDQFYFWRVKAFTDNSSTAWSNVGSFYTGNPFQSALPVSPTNGSLDQATSLSFKWIRAKNQEPYAKFELSTTPDFSYYSYLNYTSDSVLTVNENIYPNGQYYWRITTTHYFNNKYYEVTSPTFTFNTLTTTSVALIAPIQGAYAIGSSPYFLWGRSPNAHHYVFQISDNNFNSVMSEQVVFTNEFRLPFKLGENKYYYWRVAMVDNQNTMWSETRNFFTGDPYQPVTLVQPLNQSAEQPLSVEFNWERTFDNQNYIFQLSNTQDFSSIYHEQILSDTLTRVDNLQPSQQYFWRVMHSRTFNENNFTVTSPTYSFRTTSITDAADPLSEGKLVGYPNPFVDEIFIRFYTKKPGPTFLTIVDSFGKSVKQFTYEAERAGLNAVRWNGANEKNEKLSSGIYFVILQMAENTDQIKIVLAK